MIIGIAGKKRAGKDTIARFLIEEYGYTRCAFGDPVKEMALVIDPHLWVQEEGVWCFLSSLVNEYGWEEAKKYYAVREFLQTLGTEACRGILGEDCWIRALDKHIEDNDLRDVVISDVRFSNESTYCNAIIEVRAPWTDSTDTHASEQGFEHGGWIIENNGTIEELKQEVRSVMTQILATQD